MGDARGLNANARCDVMPIATPTLECLRACIGRELEFEGHQCRVIEVLEDGPALVLSCETAATVIQPNQHGDATRRVPRTRTVPMLNAEGTALNPDFVALKLPCLAG